MELKSKQIANYLFFVQGLGAVFFGVFASAYILALPSNGVLHGDPIYRLFLSVFGGLFLLSVAVGIVLAKITGS